MKYYKKILEGVVDIINTTEKSDIGFVNICTYIGENCPELAESEDEKIRKGAITSIKRFIEYTEEEDCAPDIKDMLIKNAKKQIAWLEKQGEKKPAELSNTCEFSIKTWINIVAYVLKEHNGIGNYLDDPEVKDTAEKLQKRYKFDSASEEWDDEKKEPKKIEQTYTNNQFTLEQTSILDRHIDKFLEEKSAWSEEDEIKIKSITALLKSPALCAMDGNKGIIDESIKYLKSLKDRVQPKQEWSEEDKAMVEDIIEAIDTQYAVTDYNEMINWLKSLKDRYTWKPSDEQIQALEYQVHSTFEGSWQYKASKKLLEQLKKL